MRHFLICGQKGTPYEGGEYVGKLIYSQRYPIEGPVFCIFTPNGRFNTGQNIELYNWCCCSINDWKSSSTILNVINDIFTVWLNDDIFNHTDVTSSVFCESWEEREIKARESIQYNFTHWGNIYKKFDKRSLISHYSHV